MSMSTHVVGFRPPDKLWLQMKEVWDACVAANILHPPEVESFFDGEPPDPSGVHVEIDATEWRDDMREGYEVDVRSLPEHVYVIRFYNSW